MEGATVELPPSLEVIVAVLVALLACRRFRLFALTSGRRRPLKMARHRSNKTAIRRILYVVVRCMNCGQSSRTAIEGWNIEPSADVRCSRTREQKVGTFLGRGESDRIGREAEDESSSRGGEGNSKEIRHNGHVLCRIRERIHSKRCTTWRFGPKDAS